MKRLAAAITVVVVLAAAVCVAVFAPFGVISYFEDEQPQRRLGDVRQPCLEEDEVRVNGHCRHFDDLPERQREAVLRLTARCGYPPGAYLLVRDGEVSGGCAVGAPPARPVTP